MPPPPCFLRKVFHRKDLGVDFCLQSLDFKGWGAVQVMAAKLGCSRGRPRPGRSRALARRVLQTHISVLEMWGTRRSSRFGHDFAADGDARTIEPNAAGDGCTGICGNLEAAVVVEKGMEEEPRGGGALLFGGEDCWRVVATDEWGQATCSIALTQ